MGLLRKLLLLAPLVFFKCVSQLDKIPYLIPVLFAVMSSMRIVMGQAWGAKWLWKKVEEKWEWVKHESRFKDIVKVIFEEVIMAQCGVLLPENQGYALLTEDGVFLDHLIQSPRVFELQLCDYALEMIGGVKEMQGQNFLQIGIGSGRVLKHIMEKYQPTQAFALDPSGVNIQRTQIFMSKMTNITYLNLSLPDLNLVLPSSSLDYILCLQPHFYHELSLPILLREVEEYLKPDGLFILVKVIPSIEKGRVQEIIQERMEIFREEEIRVNVVHSLTMQSERLEEQIRQRVPWYLKPYMRERLAVKDSDAFRNMKSNVMTCVVYILRKKQYF